MNSLQMLLKFMDEVEENIIFYKELCRTRKLLFKPWVQAKKLDDQSNKQEEKENTNALTEDEKRELTRVDRLLSRAQKTLDVQQKLKETSKKTAKLQISSTFNDEEKSIIPINTEEQGSHNSIRDNDSNSPGEKLTPVSVLPDDSVEHKNKHIVKKSNKKQIEKEIPKTSVISQSKLDRLIGNSASGNRTKSSKIVPAHIKAPFKTNPALPAPKRNVKSTVNRPLSGPRGVKNHSARNSVVSKRETTPQNVVSNNTRQLPNLSRQQVHRNSQQNVSTQPETSTDEIVKSEQMKTQEELNTDEIMVIQNKIPAHDENLNCNVELRTSKETSWSSGTPHEEKVKKNEDEVSNQQKEQLEKKSENRFCLATDGSKLNIPNKLRRHFANNTRLKQKISSHKLTKKVEACTCQQHFLTQLEETFEHTEEMYVGKKVRNLERIYTKLLHLLHSMMLEGVSDTSSCYEILRARKLLELLLTTFYCTEEERLQTNTDILSAIPNSKYKEVQIPSPKPVLSSTLWLPRTAETDTRIEEYLSTSPILQYSNRKEIEKYHNLIFQIQHLQLQLTILDMVTTDILPFLKSCDVNDRETTQILRFMYSIVNCNRTYPVIVKDTIQELEESLMDDDEPS